MLPNFLLWSDPDALHGPCHKVHKHPFALIHNRAILNADAGVESGQVDVIRCSWVDAQVLDHQVEDVHVHLPSNICVVSLKRAPYFGPEPGLEVKSVHVHTIRFVILP